MKIFIFPTFVITQALGKDGNCRMCMVETDGQKRIGIACDTILLKMGHCNNKGEKIEK